MSIIDNYHMIVNTILIVINGVKGGGVVESMKLNKHNETI